VTGKPPNTSQYANNITIISKKRGGRETNRAALEHRGLKKRGKKVTIDQVTDPRGKKALDLMKRSQGGRRNIKTTIRTFGITNSKEDKGPQAGISKRWAILKRNAI